MIVQTTIKPDGDKDAEKVEKEHWEKVKENEAKLLAARKWHKKRMER